MLIQILYRIRVIIDLPRLLIIPDNSKIIHNNKNMKKIVLYLSVLASIAFLGACNQLNEYPAFDDADAFVAFESERISVKEDADSLLVPVRLTSLTNKTSTVTFEIIDSTAERGVDFEVRGGANILTFDGSTAVLNIGFDILPKTGVFTGDLLFGVIIKSATGVNIGSNDTTFITINDIDHPLSAILGDYTVYGPNYFGGRADTWKVTFEKDAEDVSKIWISNLVVAGTNQKVYGVVNEEKDKIEIPVGQTIATSSSYTSIVLAGFDDPDIDVAGLMEDGAKLTMNLTSTSPIVFTMDLPFGSHIVDVDSWYSIVLAGATFTKQ